MKTSTVKYILLPDMNREEVVTVLNKVVMAGMPAIMNKAIHSKVNKYSQKMLGLTLNVHRYKARFGVKFWVTIVHNSLTYALISNLTIIFTSHFFERVEERTGVVIDEFIKSTVLRPGRLITPDLEVTDGFIDCRFLMPSGLGLGKFDQKKNILHLNTLVSKELLRPGQIPEEIRLNYSNLRYC